MRMREKGKEKKMRRRRMKMFVLMKGEGLVLSDCHSLIALSMVKYWTDYSKVAIYFALV